MDYYLIESDNLIMQLFKPTSFSPLLAFVGILLLMIFKKERIKDVGTILLGFAVLMFGMDMMSGAVSGLKESPEFQQICLYRDQHNRFRRPQQPC